MRKQERELRALAREFGGALSFRKSGHVAIELPNGQTYTTGATPSDNRARLNLLRDLRKLAGQ